MMIKRKMARFIFCAIFLVGCGGRLDIDDVYGEYLADYHGSVDRLIIFRDGSYTHSYILDGIEKTSSGVWEEETLEGEKLGLTFNDFVFRDRGGGVKEPGFWHVEVTSGLFGKTKKLCFDPDLGFCFVSK